MRSTGGPAADSDTAASHAKPTMNSYALVVVTDAVEEPVAPAEAKLNSRIDYADEDALYALWIPAARKLLETECGTALVNKTLRLELPTWPCDGRIEIPVGPVSAVNSVKYYDVDDTLTTLVANTDYLTWLSHRPPLVYPAPNVSWPSTRFGKVPTVLVEFVAGHGSSSQQVPQTAKQAILLVTNYWARNRGDEEAPEKLGLPPGAIRLMRNLNHTGYR